MTKEQAIAESERRFPANEIFDTHYVELKPSEVKKVQRDAFIEGFQFAQSQWISVEERLPETTERVLAIFEGNNITTTVVCSYTAQGQFYSRGERLNITHWMPLPPAPSNDKI